MSLNRKPPFALWVENVDPLRLDAKDLWESFARYGDMCKPREHGARAVEIFPDQKAAIVNFACYEHAVAALKGLQGALIGKITRPGLSVSWHKRQDDPHKQQAQQVLLHEQGGNDRPPFFGLWVGNVHASLVHEEDFRAAFEKYGDLCSTQMHGVPAVALLPDSSSAFVNYDKVDDANAARKGLQGKVVGGGGPLFINASDLMQEYEQYRHTHTPLQLQQIQIQHPPGTPGYNSKPLVLPYADADDLCGEDGPVYPLLGGEMYVYETPDMVKLFEHKLLAAATHAIY